MMTNVNETQIFTQEELAEARPDAALPPPGHARDEVLRERADTLEQKAEEIFEDRGAINPEAFEIDREIQHLLHDRNDGLEISDPHPAYMYCWANFQNSNGTQVWQRKSWGWEVVGGNMPECSHLRREDGTRRIGDVLLMRIRKDLHLLLEQKNEKKRLRQQYGVDADLQTIVANNPKAFRSVRTSDRNPEDPLIQRTMTAGEASSGARRAAMQQVDSMLRAGNVPGMAHPQRRGVR
jgi:hypothetical protein